MEYNSLEVSMTPELFDRSIKGSPKTAVKELIWNALDADATEIEVMFESDGDPKYPRITSVIVKDNGNGIPYEQVEELFGNFGCSNKTNTYKSPAGRVYHGKHGQGRYKSFAIGCYVKWTTIYLCEDGQKYQYDIHIDSSERLKANFSRNKIPVDISIHTGTTVEVYGITSDKSGAISRLSNYDDILPDLISTFATYLIAYKNISLIYEGRAIKPESYINDIFNETIEFVDENEEVFRASVTVINWNSINLSNIYFCGEDGVVFDEKELSILQKESMSLHIMSAYYQKMHLENTLNMGELDPVFSSLLDLAKDFLRQCIKENYLTDAEDEIRQIKTTKIYPYEDQPKSEVERVEREVFDILAIEVNKVVPDLRKANQSTKKLTYKLIQEAVRTNPSSIKRILSEVFDLTKEQQDNLAEMLSYTTLPAIIDTAKTIGDRLTFIYMLEEMVYNDSIGKPIKERSQFHKILLKELWVFGEKYFLGTSDKSLKNVLLKHIKCLGREDLIPNIPPEATENLSAIPDICLFNQTCIGYEMLENLVIELKKPTLTLGKNELDQIENYAITVSANPIFAKDSTKWNFILIGKDFNDYVKEKLKNKVLGTGNLYNTDTVSVSVLKWSDVIQENKFKYEHLREKLNFQLSDDPDIAVDYLLKKHAELFPKTS